MTALDLAPASLDAVVAFYSLTHVPRADLPDLLAAMHRWLRPGGVLIASMGAQDSPDSVEADWLGAPMFFSHHGAKKNRALVRRAGFETRGGRGRSGARGPARRPVPVGRRAPARGGPRCLKAGASIRARPSRLAAGVDPRRDRRPGASRLPERIVRADRRRRPRRGRRPGAPLRPHAEQGRLAVSLRDRPERAAATDHRDRRRGRGLLGDRPLAHAHPGRSVPDRHRAGVLSGCALSARHAERDRGRPDDQEKR